MRRLIWLGAGLFLTNCVCSNPISTNDAGDPLLGTPCSVDTECALGQACVEGYCGSPVTPDAGVTCTRNEDCPMGQLCLPSTGQCFTPIDSDSGDVDGGLITGSCNPGETTSCGSSKLGLCRLGTASCEVINGAYAFGPCVGNIEPVAEVCNGLDDDCDGLIDDGFADLSCGVGECRRTVPGCVNGAVNTCVAGTPSTEVCDNKDNDCNGVTDDMPMIVCGTGECRRTAVACDAGVPGVCAPGAPTSELCDGKDNDCNGSVDDGFSFVNCGQGICFNTVYPCSDGGVVACQPLPGQATEDCFTSVDDNCNGLVNEFCACTAGQSISCYTGPNGTADAGVCHYGTQSCDAGQFGPCVGEVVPSVETCNNADDNCNGIVDDMGSTSCGQGECLVTVPNCIAGVPQTCRAKDAGVEICNGKDDDCDGTADNNIPNLTCGVGACFRSVPACVGPNNNTCNQGAPTVESCNSVDDDCNNVVDDIPDAGCSTGQSGRCSAGHVVCTGGVTSCVRNLNPIPEVCSNGIDDDCNGSIDVGAGCCDAGVDLDFDGYDQCSDCNDLNGAVHPGAIELCNGYDDNCNGQIDEGFDKDNDGFTTCGTKDGGGIDIRLVDCNDDAGFVFPGKATDCGNAATPNVANGVDDNCNGYTDETCGCNPAIDNDNDGFNQCVDCNDNNAQIYPGHPETCNGLDDDCNRATLDNCGVSQPCGYKMGGTWYNWPTGTDRCKSDLVCVQSVSTGALTCGSYCNQTPGLGLNDSCLANQVCDRFLVDADKLNLCSEYTPWSGNAQVGAFCLADTDCASHTCRADGTLYCTDNCNHESACPNATTCYVQNLQTNKVGPTTYYAYISQCRKDANIAGATLQGGACATNANCRSGVCFQGKCSEPCCAHSDCGGGSACGFGPTQAIGFTSGGVNLLSMVPACRYNVGTRPSGAACTLNADCKSRICDGTQGVCADLCCNDSSCTTPGQTCEPLPVFIPDGGVLDVVRACVFSPIPNELRMRTVP